MNPAKHSSWPRTGGVINTTTRDTVLARRKTKEKAIGRRGLLGLLQGALRASIADLGSQKMRRPGPSDRARRLVWGRGFRLCKRAFSHNLTQLLYAGHSSSLCA